MILPTHLYLWSNYEWRIWSMVVTRRKLKVIDLYKFNNDGITSMLVFADALSAMER